MGDDLNTLLTVENIPPNMENLQFMHDNGVIIHVFDQKEKCIRKKKSILQLARNQARFEMAHRTWERSGKKGAPPEISPLHIDEGIPFGEFMNTKPFAIHGERPETQNKG